MKTDNRWNSGSLESKVPETALAAYGARWIDHGEFMDIVPDRQGFAYDDAGDRDRLIEAMEFADLRSIAVGMDRGDDPLNVVTNADVNFNCWMRRAGGYVYVAAWID